MLQAAPGELSAVAAAADFEEASWELSPPHVCVMSHCGIRGTECASPN